MITEDKRFTLWLSSHSLPLIRITLGAGCSTIAPDDSSYPENWTMAPSSESKTLPRKPAIPPKTTIDHWGGLWLRDRAPRKRRRECSTQSPPTSLLWHWRRVLLTWCHRWCLWGGLSGWWWAGFRSFSQRCRARMRKYLLHCNREPRRRPVRAKSPCNRTRSSTVARRVQRRWGRWWPIRRPCPHCRGIESSSSVLLPWTRIRSCVWDAAWTWWPWSRRRRRRWDSPENSSCSERERSQQLVQLVLHSDSSSCAWDPTMQTRWEWELQPATSRVVSRAAPHCHSTTMEPIPPCATQWKKRTIWAPNVLPILNHRKVTQWEEGNESDLPSFSKSVWKTLGLNIIPLTSTKVTNRGLLLYFTNRSFIKENSNKIFWQLRI